ncbi:MAG: DUF523 and DUF1722 domain-containing protein [Candidatus Zixiibacteriota bacterium]
MSEDIIKIGVSSCLLGAKVRFDGGHKRDRFVTDIFGGFVQFVPICPEVEVGMPIPRESVNLQGDYSAPSMIGYKTGEDWTERMNQYSNERIRRDDVSELSGYILKKDSPSCGMERVKVYTKPGQSPTKQGIGLFARALMLKYPYLPVEEEGRLNDPLLRENFIIRVFAFKRLQNLYEKRFNRGEMVEFHTRHKYLLLAHNQAIYRDMGKLVAKLKEMQPAEFKRLYRDMFMTALSYKATVKKNTNVLQHIVGFLREHVTFVEKQSIMQTIDDYHKGLVPLVVPITLIAHFIERYDVPYIKDQIYLRPHPKELMLRNHV